jgi:hypothetical protein
MREKQLFVSLEDIMWVDPLVHVVQKLEHDGRIMLEVAAVDVLSDECHKLQHVLVQCCLKEIHLQIA